MKFNSKGGKKFKRGKKNVNEKSAIIFAEDGGEEYAKVTKLLGNGRIHAVLKDKTEKLCIIPGRFKRKKIRVQLGNIILICVRDYQPDKADILFLYNDSQIEILSKSNHIPLFFKNNINTMDIHSKNNDMTDNVVFQNDSDSEDDLTIETNNKEESSSLSMNKYNNINSDSESDNDDINLEDI